MKDFLENNVNLDNFENTPYILIFSDKILESLHVFKSILNFNSDEIFYPIKVNTDTNILNLLDNLGVGFEIGAASEAEILFNSGIDLSKVIFGNPVKSISTIQRVYKIGIRRFCADHINEINKLAKYAPNSEIYFRICIDNFGAEWDLTKKFGCPFEELPFLFLSAKKLVLNPVGISFHVGWNNDCFETWEKVFETITNKINLLEKENIKLESINIGGGFPTHNKNQNELLLKISEIITPSIQTWRKQGIKVIAEPGSFLVSNSGFLVVSVIECIRRHGVNWVYIDSGIFQGFYWILSGLKYSISSTNSNSEETEEMVVCGPTCDSHDIFSYQTMLPKSIKPGDKLIINPAGAYVSSAQNYNGFYYPKQIIK